MGRARRLNSVGESITQIAPDPAAAYSLRSLTGGDPKVVRVRRESDNTEEDFTASDINSGELVDFVNRQVIKPLDVKELNSGGSGDRDGNFVIAKAAYSLRSLGDRQATVAATNDTVARADGKYVVQVRRSSDDTIKSFTADEVTDGTLVAFVGSGNDGFVRTWYDQSVSDQGSTATGNHAVQTDATEQPLVISNGSLVTNGGLSFNGTTQGLEMPEGSIFSDLNSCSTFVIAKSDTTGSTDIAIALSDSDNNKRWYSPIIIGGKLNFGYGSSASAIEYSTADTNKHLFTAIAGSSTAEAFLDGTSKGTVSSVSGQDAVAGINLGGANDTLFWDGNIEEVIIYNTDQTDNRGAFEANIAEHYNISGVPAEDNEVNGFVETWYDQSGNGKNAVQATSTNQPKIVDSGVLVTETRSGVTTPAIKFTSDSGTPANGNFLETSSNYLTTSDSAITTCLVVPAQDDASNEKGILGKNNSNNRISIDHSGANGYRFNIPARRVYANSDQTIGDVDLYFNVVAGTSANTDDECFRNNTQLTNHTGTVSSVGADMNQIGARKGGTADAEGTDGNYQEVIIYTSDLRSDGANIRNNIINHYSLPQD